MDEILTIGEFGRKLFGTAPPTPDDMLICQKILDATPKGDALTIARYIMDDKHVNSDGEFFNSEWKVRSNPLIVTFFREATTSTDEDITDKTKWCAAFLNWCLKRSGARYTNSASSGSFRCYSEPAAPPKPGDIAVYKNRHQNLPCSGSGHVGFWLSDDATHVATLGGNQGDRVKISRFPKTDTGVELLWLLTVRRPKLDITR